MPSVAWACAITHLPGPLAVSTRTPDFFPGVKWAWRGINAGKHPARSRHLDDVGTHADGSPTFWRISSGPSTMVSGTPGCTASSRILLYPDGIHPSP